MSGDATFAEAIVEETVSPSIQEETQRTQEAQQHPNSFPPSLPRPVRVATPVIVEGNDTPVPLVTTNETPVAYSHYYEWFPYYIYSGVPINGRVRKIGWGIKLPGGIILCENRDNEVYSPLDYFLFSFPPKLLQVCIDLTNRELKKRGQSNVTEWEMMKLFGVQILIKKILIHLKRFIVGDISTQ